MAAAWFNALADSSKAEAMSAGTQPGTSVHPEVLDAMQEVGIDLRDARPQLLSDELAGTVRMLVTMGCGEACPHVPGIQRLDWPLRDPKGRPPAEVRAICAEIRQLVYDLLESNAWVRTTPLVRRPSSEVM